MPCETLPDLSDSLSTALCISAGACSPGDSEHDGTEALGRTLHCYPTADFLAKQSAHRRERRVRVWPLCVLGVARRVNELSNCVTT